MDVIKNYFCIIDDAPIEHRREINKNNYLSKVVEISDVGVRKERVNW